MSIVKVLEGPGGGGRGGGAVVEVVGSVEDWDLFDCFGRRVRGPVLKMHSLLESRHLLHIPN